MILLAIDEQGLNRSVTSTCARTAGRPEACFLPAGSPVFFSVEQTQHGIVVRISGGHSGLGTEMD